jgi:transcriptional regulator with XRE-family HTH domain
MSLKLSQKQIGRRVAEIRRMKGLSQQDLAKRIRLSRPSLAQIELGNRSLNIMELQMLSDVLGFSLDDFMSNDYKVNEEIGLYTEVKTKIQEERISIPDLQVNKFKNVLLYILEKCAGEPNIGETFLYKLLYFSDFNYYELYEEQLTGATYRKLLRVKTEYCGYPQTRYFPLVKADLTQLKASEKDVIDRVIEQMRNWSAEAISNYSHKDLPWEVTDEGKDISYELALYRELPFSVRVYDKNDD